MKVMDKAEISVGTEEMRICVIGISEDGRKIFLENHMTLVPEKPLDIKKLQEELDNYGIGKITIVREEGNKLTDVTDAYWKEN